MIQRLAMATAFVVCVAFAGAARADDKEKIQGTWKPEKMVRGGKKAPAEELEKLSLTFKANKVTPKDGDKEEREAEFTLDSAKKPKTIDVTNPDGKSMPGIYELIGDGLKICISMEGDRPTKFESTEGQKVMLIVLKRAKK